MGIFSFEIDAWMAALFLAILMIIAWQIGWRAGLKKTASGKASGFNLTDAIMGLFALLLGFTVSMALSKHDQRRLMMVNDANCIGDFASTAAMLKPQHRDAILRIVKDYVKLLLTQVSNPSDQKLVDQRLEEIAHVHDALLEKVRDAIQEGTPVTVPLMVTYNGLTSSQVSRLASLRDRLPGSIMLLLVLAATISTFLQGHRQGQENILSIIPTLIMILLISMVVWVILDLNQPNRGLINVSKEPLERLLMGLGN
ncbi:MAG TPA: hypothetical protein PLN21_05795 [Gemmatales bacterium]|nr:hypothetical protein [Gemmatales bacterium]